MLGVIAHVTRAAPRNAPSRTLGNASNTMLQLTHFAAAALLVASARASPCAATHSLHADGSISAGFSADSPHTPLCAGTTAAPRPLGAGATGATYSLWHAPAVAALNEVAEKGGAQLTIEDLIRARGSLMLADVYDKWNVTIEDALYYQQFPASGPYCMYRHRDGETGLLPDCAGISATAARHADMLTKVGVDFIALDATNLCTPSDQVEVIQTRPMQVVFEEFAALRAAGTTTPAIAPWWPLRAECTMHPVVLALYNDPRYEGLVQRDGSGKKVWFTPAGPDPTLVATVESNGGRNDIVVIQMWANFAKNEYDEGVCK